MSMVYLLLVEAEIEFLAAGGVTSPQGFQAGAVSAGIKETAGSLDLALLCSRSPSRAVALFTCNRIKAAPLVLSKRMLPSDAVRGVVVASGCANTATGEAGLQDAVEMTRLAAESIGVGQNEMVVASTGVIGRRLPMDKIAEGMKRITLSPQGGDGFARAIMTTDTVPKQAAVGFEVDGARCIIGGSAKGSGMIHPDMATLLVFITTDAAVDTGFLKAALKEAADASFNMVSIDGDTSPNDMMLIMANGVGGAAISSNEGKRRFQAALEALCVGLAREIARDGEGATRLIEVVVEGAPKLEDARVVARTIVSSPLVKAAVHGGDPNWGRVLAAAGRSGVAVEEAKISLAIGGVDVVAGGVPLPFDEAEAAAVLKGDEVRISLKLNLGDATATAWGCDLSQEYVTINSDYTT